MKELLEEIVSKFNACKEDGLHYGTYKDKGLAEAIAKAEAALKGEVINQADSITEDSLNASVEKKSKGKK